MRRGARLFFWFGCSGEHAAESVSASRGKRAPVLVLIVPTIPSDRGG